MSDRPYCAACAGKDYATCVGCGMHFLPANPSGRCFACREADPDG